MADTFYHTSADDHFAELVTRYFNGPLQQGDLDTLARLLETQPAARRMFVHIARLDGLLTERSLTGKQALPIATDWLDQSSEEDASQLSLHDATVHTAIREEDIQGSIDESTFTPDWNVDPAPVAAASNQASYKLVVRLSTAAVLVLAVLVAFFGLHHPGRQAPIAANNPLTSSIPVVSPTTNPTGNPTFTNLTVAESPVRLAAAVQAQWADGLSPLAVNDVIPEKPLSLKSGWIRLDFATGVSAVIEAPARFTVRSGSLVSLQRGRISAQVPTDGIGFSVESPACKIVDLGTEFGLSVDEKGRNQVSVFKGKVSFSRTNSESPDPGSHQIPAEILSVGEGRRIESATSPAVSTSAEANSFVRVEQFNHWAGAFTSDVDRWRVYNEQLARDPSLMLFYTFDETTPGVMKNHASTTFGQYDLPLTAGHSPSVVQGRMAGITALNFEAAKKQYLVLPRYPITQTGMLTCSTWIKARSYVTYGSILKNWGDSKAGAFHLGVAAGTHLLEVQLDGMRPGGPVLRDLHRFEIGQWIHLVFVSNGTTVRLYRDGVEVASGATRLIANDPPISSLAIGCKTGDDGLTPIDTLAAGFWDGQIGEIALFNRALSSSEIARMSQHGR